MTSTFTTLHSLALAMRMPMPMRGPGGDVFVGANVSG
jgi:hypothetical protein